MIPASGFSFPSGHAMVSAAVYLFVAYLAWRHLKGPAWTYSVVQYGRFTKAWGSSRSRSACRM